VRIEIIKSWVNRTTLVLSCFAVISLSSPVARADVATVNIGLSGLPPYIDTVNNETVYVGPIQGTLSTPGQQSSPIVLWCDDFGHTTYVPTTYQVNVSYFDSLTYVRFGGDPGGDSQLQKYEKAAWLMLQFPTISPTNQTVGAIQTAIWHIFDPNVQLTSDAADWINKANGHDLTLYDFSSVRILTPVCSGSDCDSSPQEFLDPLPAVPEPSSILLFGTGLLIAGTALRKARRRAAPKP
jgi:hypothetical protein